MYAHLPHSLLNLFDARVLHFVQLNFDLALDVAPRNKVRLRRWTNRALILYKLFLEFVASGHLRLVGFLLREDFSLFGFLFFLCYAFLFESVLVQAVLFDLDGFFGLFELFMEAFLLLACAFELAFFLLLIYPS